MKGNFTCVWRKSNPINSSYTPKKQTKLKSTQSISWIKVYQKKKLTKTPLTSPINFTDHNTLNKCEKLFQTHPTDSRSHSLLKQVRGLHGSFGSLLALSSRFTSPKVTSKRDVHLCFAKWGDKIFLKGIH